MQFRVARTALLYHIRHLLLWIGAYFTLLVGAVGFSYAQAPSQSTPSSKAWSVSADRIDYDQIQDQYTITGDVTIYRDGRTLTANKVLLNQKTREALAQGNVRLVSGDDILSGKQLQMNLDSETGTLTDGNIFISKNHLYLSGEKINKTGPQTFTAKKVRITSCDGTDPDWELTGHDFKVTIEGYGYAKHTKFWAGKIPLFYSPYLAFPVKLKRQSGLLMPEFYYGDRKGHQYIQPLFWAINENSDATLYAHSMSRRGLRTGLEYRYVLDETSLGTLMAEGFKDFRIDDGLNDNSKRWGYSNDEQLRINKDRYWIRMKHNQSFESDQNLKLDIDVVSDQDYLPEFRTVYNGFNDTKGYFQETFGRDIDDYNDPVRLNRLNINRTWNRYSLNADLRWYDDVIKRRFKETDDRIKEADDTVQQLPAISFNGIKQPLTTSPFYFDFVGSYAHLYRINGTRGHRTDIYPRIYYPMTLWQTISIEPSAGLRQTAWQLDHYETRPDHNRDTLYRAIYDLKLDVSSELFRTYKFSLAGSDQLKHAITPEIIYEFTPEEEQSDFPEFDALDRIERKNLITYGFTNFFTARTPRRTKNGPDDYTYTPFLRFKLSQSFDINKDREGDPRPFSNIAAELDLTPGRNVALDTDFQWSPYDSQFETFNTILRFWDLRGDKMTIDYRYTRENDDPVQENIHSLRLSGQAVISDKWRLRAGYEFDLVDNNEIESSVGVSYKHQCWSADLDSRVEEGSRSYHIMFNLAGLGFKDP